MKITRLNKSLAALIILFFFVLGAFAVSLAHGSPLDGEFHSAGLRLILKNVPARVHTFNSLFQLATGAIVTPPLVDGDRSRFLGKCFNAPVGPKLLAQIHVPKVSLQILQSILLL